MFFDDFDLFTTIEEFYDDNCSDEFFWDDDEPEPEDFPDDEMGYNPYMGCYDWDC